MTNNIIAQVIEQLQDYGWQKNEITTHHSFQDHKEIWRPSLILIRELNPLAVVEIISSIESRQQLKRQSLLARTHGIPFFFLTDGQKTFEFDVALEDFRECTKLPSPDELIQRFPAEKSDFFLDPRLSPSFPMAERQPLRYYQIEAINRTIEELMAGHKKLLVMLPHGSGVSSIQIHLAWKLILSGYSKRLLFISDRNPLLSSYSSKADEVEPSIRIHQISELGEISKSINTKDVNEIFSVVIPRALDSYVLNNIEPHLQAVPPDAFDIVLIDLSSSRMANILDAISSHFQQAKVVGFFPETERNKLSTYSKEWVTAFTLSFEQLVQDEIIVPPTGFTAVPLGGLGDFRTGAHVQSAVFEPSNSLPVLPSIGHESPEAEVITDPVFVVNVRDIKNGYLDLKRARQVSKRKLIQMTSIRTNEHEEIDSSYLLQTNDLVFVAVGRVGEVAIVPDELPGPVIFSSSLFRFRAREEILTSSIHSFLKSDAGQTKLKRLEEGTAQPRLTISSLKQLVVFLPQLQRQFEQNKAEAIHITDSAFYALDGFEDSAADVPPICPNIIAQEDQANNISQNPDLSTSSTAWRRISENILPLLKNDAENDEEINLQLVAARLREVANDLCPPLLGERVKLSYPAPIALAYQRYDDARFNTFERVLRLKDLAEASCFFIYNVLLADVCHRLDSARYFCSDNGARRAYNGFSMAARLDFVNSIIQSAIPNEGEDLFIPEFTKVPEIVTIGKTLQDEFRNRISHTASASESQQQRLLKEFEPQVLSLLEKLEFLSNYKLARVPSFYYEQGELKRQMIIYNGTVPFLDETSISLESLTPMERDHLILLDAEDQVLDLYPIYQLHSDEDTRWETHLCFLKQRKSKDCFLDGESVNGAFPVKLQGFEDFEALQRRILDKPVSNET